MSSLATSVHAIENSYYEQDGSCTIFCLYLRKSLNVQWTTLIHVQNSKVFTIQGLVLRKQV